MRARAALMAAAILGGAGSAHALTIKPLFDSSITSLTNAAQVESDFNTVAQFYDNALTSPVTVYVGVSWGKVQGRAMGPGALGSSVDNLYGFFNYGQVKSYLTAASGKSGNTALAKAVKSLPASDPAGVNQYAIPYAEAKALGVIPGTQLGYDGYVGFSQSASFDFNPSDGIAAGSYDFETVVAHELDEVLGRITGLTSASPTFRTPMDLYRYGAPGQLGFGYKAPAYFSIDGGVTKMGDFSYNSGDRSDWLTSTTGVGDIQAANATKGVLGAITAADLTLLDALGWGGSNAGDTNISTPTLKVRSFQSGDVPEPESWVMLMLGFGTLGAGLRARRRPAIAAAH
jgi:hypothetical protein